MYSIGSTTLIGVEKTTAGLWTLVHAPTSGMTIDTTASTYAVGCVVMNLADGIKYFNRGTTAAPVWETESLEKSVSLTSAEIFTLYSVGKEIIPAVPGKAIILDSFVFDLTGTATQFTTGGVVNLQYKSTVNGAGTTLHADIAATVVTGATARVVTQRIPKDISATAVADIVNIPVYIGAKTADFAVGTGTAICRVKYHLI